MKKLVTVLAMLTLALCLSISALAAPKGFVSSPEAQSGPTIESFKNDSEDCTAKLVITPYSEKEELPQKLVDLINKAYSDVKNAEDLTKLNVDLEALAKELGISPKDLAVSDLFDIHYTDCETHVGHEEFDIVLKAESLKRFVALLHLNGDKWELIKDAKVTENGTHLTFSVEEFSPFAIVVNTSEEDKKSPVTSDNTASAVCVAIMLASAAALVYVWKKSKKQSV